MKGSLSLLLAVLGALASAQTADALINPKYTVSDLASDSGQILVLRVSALPDGVISGEVVESLTGTVPAEKTLAFDFSNAGDLAADKVTAAFAGAKTALAVMCVQKKQQDGALVGAIEIGTSWMGLTRGDKPGLWKLDKDPNDLETVWGGSARQLVVAIRYALSDPSANFPVASTLNWGRDLSLGKIVGKVNGCIVTEDGVIVLSDGGDRVWQPGRNGMPPVDATEKLGMVSKSKAMAAGDFNGDGQSDLASWDGSRVWFLFRGADGKLATPTAGRALAECLSLGGLGGGIVAGGSKGAVLLMPDGKEKFLIGAGGPCIVADFNNDGAPDVMQVSAHELTMHPGLREPGAFAAPVVTMLDTVKNPVSVVCGDYDTDGQLDLFVAGEGGAALMIRDEAGRWTSAMTESGELGAALSGEATAVAACPSDINGDGRQCATLFMAAASPGLFFNRGFACFGVARSLTFVEAKLPAAAALGRGQLTGTVLDLNGDLAPDLFAVDPQQNAWVMFTESKESRRFQLIAQTGGKDPLTVTASLGRRQIGVWIVRPGELTVIGIPKAGKVTLRWKTADGLETARDAIVTAPIRIKL